MFRSTVRRLRSDGRRRDERGVTTAEYAVATAAGAGFAGLLYKAAQRRTRHPGSSRPSSTTCSACWDCDEGRLPDSSRRAGCRHRRAWPSVSRSCSP
ncbi:DUF4244 domain-containing protein [Nocardioides convexus]|uniref:DUF4244 domain-containing protein n=1 Tax=Nocardioides convexus TaxID=2712224 RepID=UPI0024181651|nr:DUF4244 domain-containing protein [Nocardioides convexus]